MSQATDLAVRDLPSTRGFSKEEGDCEREDAGSWFSSCDLTGAYCGEEATCGAIRRSDRDHLHAATRLTANADLHHEPKICLRGEVRGATPPPN